MSELKPALTPEQWKMDGGKDVQMLRAANEGPRVMFRPERRSADGRYRVDEGFGVELNADNSLAVWDNSWGIAVPAETRHGLAALALYGQPFGFTQDEAAAVRECGVPFDQAIDEKDTLACRLCDQQIYGRVFCVEHRRALAASAAAKMAALLPPVA